MKILILALVFQAGEYKIMNRNPWAMVERVKSGTFRLKTNKTIGDCDIKPMDGHITPAFQFYQHEDKKTFTTMLVGLRKIDINIYVQCEVGNGKVVSL